ncbi:PTS sugar transporter subunit IIA [Phytoactinopolyspora limicola]|uniref:PTS sugar transporter subunit IIA n=1 Tax=Phytoactinopolyspora limicola TaxID=2715536 RepID=UPI00140C0E4E|nr:PTS sugar transporter subunit IIA [Phytoactinopolyspora limicola]
MSEPDDDAPVVAAATGVNAADWRAAVRAACQPLVDAGAVEPRYTDRCVDMVEEHGPYMVLTPGLALAHARPTDGVRRLCLAATTLTEPVMFGHPDNDPVDLLIAFGSPDDSSHIGLLQKLAEHLLAGLADTLRDAPDRARAIRALETVVADL